MDERSLTLFEGGRIAAVQKVIRVVFGDVLSRVDRDIYNGELLPKHGPGKTSDSLHGNQKWTLPNWHMRLEKLFPYSEYAIPNERYWEKPTYQVKYLTPEEERPVKLTAVPKTRTTPRLIAIEPTCMQYIQQAISIPLRQYAETQRLNGAANLASWFVGFEHQWPNQAMAQIGSEDGSLATLDLSEASDRVANWLVEALFADFPWFLEGIQACRSTRVRLPSGEVIPIQKFASMGSALTFPIEAIVFAAIVLEACVRAVGKPAVRESFIELFDKVRVYGDDIICPTDVAETVIDSLETFGFKVNRNKSFWTGEYRESCGKEYWNGYDVSIVRVRKALPTSLRDVDQVVSSVATRNLLFKAGLWRTVDLYDYVLVRALQGHFPYVAETSPILGRLHREGHIEVHDSSFRGTQIPMTKGFVVQPKRGKNLLDGQDALLKCLLEAIGQPKVDEKHLMRSGLRKAVKLKLSWASPY